MIKACDHCARSALRIGAQDLDAQFRAVFGQPLDQLEAYATEIGGRNLTLDEAGLAIVAAMLGATTPDDAIFAARALSLTDVTLIDMAGRGVEMPGAAAREHPLLANWVANDLGGAIGDLLRAGAIWTQTAPGAPRYVSLELRFDGGQFGAVLSMVIEAATTYGITARFGAVPKLLVQRSIAISVDALMGLGAGLTLLSPPQAATAEIVPFPNSRAFNPAATRH
jgi:hypothetical protein